MAQGADSAAGTPKHVLVNWEEDVTAIREAIDLIIKNKATEADARIDEASTTVQGRKVDFNSGEHDLRGLFALTKAIFALVAGLASLQKDQLPQVLSRLQEADKLLAEDRDWAGKSLFQGIVILGLGMCQVVEAKIARGIWNVLRSWSYLRSLEKEGLNYAGHERDVIRSMSLCGLGEFHLIVSMLPRRLMQTATWLTGFHGSREQGLDMLRRCWKEGGIEAPLAGLALLTFYVDTSDFLGEPLALRKERYVEARAILDWGLERYPDSFWWQGQLANYSCVTHDVEKAQEVLKACKSMIADTPAYVLMCNIGNAKFNMTMLQWAEAAESFRQAADVHRNVDRRAFCPEMLMSEHLCWVAAENMEKAREALDLCLTYKQEKKKWIDNDKDSLDKAEIAKAAMEASPGKKAGQSWRPMLVLCSKMVFIYRLGYAMSPARLEAFAAVVEKQVEECGDDLDSRCLALAVLAEVSRQAERWEAVQKAVDQGLALEAKVSKQGRKSGALQFLYLGIAHAHSARGNTASAKEALKKLAALPQHLYHKEVLFKATNLEALVGLEMQDSYVDLKLPARRIVRLRFKVAEASEIESVAWDWVLKDHTINFTAAFSADQGDGSPQVLDQVDQHDAKAGPYDGAATVPGPGQLVLTFDNTFSKLRTKEILFRLQPSGLEMTQEEAKE